MTITAQLSDDALLKELGRRLARRRIEMDLTQADLATQAGVAKRTLERMEAGGAGQLLSLIRVLRVLGLVEGLDRLVPAPTVHPMEVLKTGGAGRRRVRAVRRGATVPKGPWTWGDES